MSSRFVLVLVLDPYKPQSVIPRQVGGTDETAPWPSSSAHVSFTGPVDLDTFHIKDGVWPEPLIKTSVFVRLGSYLQLEDNHPPHKSAHICHVLVLFPVEQQPWRSLAGWMQTAANPFHRASWIVSRSTQTKKKKAPSSPEPIRSKRSTAGRKKPRLYY
jgi:hypothetical protein